MGYVKLISIFPTLQNLIFSHHICPLLNDIEKMQGSHFKILHPCYNYLMQGD